MSKNNKKNELIAKTESDYKKNIPPLIAGNFFSLLKANRTVNYRKNLYEFLNEFFPIGAPDDITWKGRFNNPKLIPEKGFNEIIAIMEEGLAWSLQEMRDDLKKELADTEKTIKLINIAIKTYQNEQEQS